MDVTLDDTQPRDVIEQDENTNIEHKPKRIALLIGNAKYSGQLPSLSSDKDVQKII